MMDIRDIRLNCDGYCFVDNKSANDRILTLEELLELCENLYIENSRLEEELDDLKQDVEDNYRRIPLNEQYGVSDSDFI